MSSEEELEGLLEHGERMGRPGRIRYSRESLLAVAVTEACRHNQLPAGVAASLPSFMAGILFIDRSSHHHNHHQEEETNRSIGISSSGLLWRRNVTTAPPANSPSDGPRDVLPLRRPPGDRAQTPGDGGEPKRCTRFFSTAGCRFGDGCRYLHHLPDSSSNQQAVAKMSNLLAGKMPNAAGSTATPASFGASATAKISVDASVTGAIIGWGGAIIKRIARVTGANVAIRDHGSDITLKNVELEGTFDQIKDASTMVMELLASANGGGGADAAPPAKNQLARGGGGPHHHGGTPGSKFRTRLCEHFARGSCMHGDRCRFAHGEDQLRSPGGPSTDVDATTLNFWAHGEFPSRKGGWC